MTFEIIAILGALAWLPHLIKLYRDKFTVPEVEIIAQKYPELGFNTFGPIFNLKLAFSARNKDLVIQQIKLKIQHENGECKLFSWQGISQQVFRMEYPEIGSVPLEKENSVLALKINTNDLEEKFLLFQMIDFIDKKKELDKEYLKKASFLMKDKNDITTLRKDDLLDSDELKRLISFIEHQFIWKAGKYYLTFQLYSSDKFKLKGNEYEFELTDFEVEDLLQNKKLISEHYNKMINGFPDSKETDDGNPPKDDSELPKKDNKINWNWLTPLLTKTANKAFRADG